MLLTFTGRNTGLQYTTPVIYVRNGSRVIVGVGQPETKKWWRNYREPGDVTLLIGSGHGCRSGTCVATR
ncbi:MAG: nitroreductase family deazaflavin-dependent oxidoreductase [Pseudomonadales bacterium]|nr:nitroreductase family deazaflavin-dependent oxidoreductase [Pseudomonadales bacterium]